MTKTPVETLTKFSFADSLALANDFAVKLLAGVLNMRIDYDTCGRLLAEVTRTTTYFTTELMADVRTGLSGSRLSRIEATDSEVDPHSQWPTSEIRHITIFAREGEGKEMLVATFDVHRDYLDGDNAEGWTRWEIKNVFVFLTSSGVELVPEYLDRDDREPIWGTRIQ